METGKTGPADLLYIFFYKYFPIHLPFTRPSRLKVEVYRKELVDVEDLPLADPQELDAIDLDDFWDRLDPDQVWDWQGGSESLPALGSPTVRPAKKIWPRIMGNVFSIGREFADLGQNAAETLKTATTRTVANPSAGWKGELPV